VVSGAGSADSGALFDAPAPVDPDAQIAQSHIAAYFQDPVDRALAEVARASAALEAAQQRQSAWHWRGVLSTSDADWVVLRAQNAAHEIASVLIRTPGFPNVDVDLTEYEAAKAEHAAVRRWLRAHGNPHLEPGDGEPAKPTPRPRKSRR
jgi:hypothetical protein